jgi:ketosteroid isomerase-like protein
VAAGQPEQVIEEFVKFFNARDLDGLLANLYESDAALVPEPGTGMVSGQAAIREVLQGFLAMNATMKVVSGTAYTNGDIGLTHAHWRLDVPGSDAMEGTTAEVVRRQSDGTWKYAIDNPWGGAVLDAGP